jgi:hypothetical protein
VVEDERVRQVVRTLQDGESLADAGFGANLDARDDTSAAIIAEVFKEYVGVPP